MILLGQWQYSEEVKEREGINPLPKGFPLCVKIPRGWTTIYIPLPKAPSGWIWEYTSYLPGWCVKLEKIATGRKRRGEVPLSDWTPPQPKPVPVPEKREEVVEEEIEKEMTMQEEGPPFEPADYPIPPPPSPIKAGFDWIGIAVLGFIFVSGMLNKRKREK